MVIIKQVPGATPSVVVRYEGGALTVNGAPADPGAVIEYGESCATVSDDPAVRFAVEALPSAPEDAPPVDEAGIALASWRASCWVDRWQIIAALDLIDLSHWPKIEAHAARPECDPVTRSAIRNVARIPRQSEIVDFFAWLLDLEPPQVDDLFRLAETIRG